MGRSASVLGVALAALGGRRCGAIAYVPGEIQWSPTALSLATTPGVPVQGSVTLAVRSEVSVNVLAVSISGDARHAFSVPAASFSIAGGGTADLAVTYAPPAPGPDGATLQVGTDSSDTPTIEISLTGVSGMVAATSGTSGTTSSSTTSSGTTSSGTTSSSGSTGTGSSTSLWRTRAAPQGP